MRTDDVVALLTRRIEHDQWPRDGKLPPLRELSTEIETSLPTVRKALARMQDNGVLEPLSGGNRYFVKGFAPGSHKGSDERTDGTRHERIALAIRDNLVRGTFGPGSAFPGLKELRREFACSHTTIRRALGVVESRWGMIREEMGRYVRTPSHCTSRGGTSVYLAGSPALMSSYREQFFQLVNHLERRLREIGWGQVHWFLSDKPELAIAPPDHKVSAYIHLLHGPTRGWGTFFGTKRDIPIVYIDFDEIERGRFRQHRLFVKIRPDNVKAGSQVARHLQEFGHSRVAFMSQVTIEQNQWLSGRRTGLIEILGEGGSSGSGVVDFIADHTRSEQISDSEQLRTAKQIGSLRSSFLQRGVLSPGIISLKLKGAFDLEYYHRLAAGMQNVFEQALGDTGITAWVCANDDLAIVALAFLKRKGFRVPDHISVAAFDNSPGSFPEELTSFDPGIDAIAAVAVQAISSPRSVTKDTRNIVSVPGQLVVRNSTGPARLRQRAN